VIVVEYNSTHFDPIKLLQQLRAAKSYGIQKCIWQLGLTQNQFADNITTRRKYSDDLKTLKILCESVRKDHKLDWNVAAVGEFVENEEKVPFNVEGYDFGK
jgi:hypothetical protein